MTFRNERGDELTYHGGPLDGQPLNVLAPPGPHDAGYEVRTDEGMILGPEEHPMGRPDHVHFRGDEPHSHDPYVHPWGAHKARQSDGLNRA